jgi:putative addiction module CopG family antidote
MNNTINISLPKALSDLANQQVKAGYYSSISEVIRDALRKMLMEPAVPTFKMSKKAEKVAAEAEKEYREGKTIPFTSVSDLL